MCVAIYDHISFTLPKNRPLGEMVLISTKVVTEKPPYRRLFKAVEILGTGCPAPVDAGLVPNPTWFGTNFCNGVAREVARLHSAEV